MSPGTHPHPRAPRRFEPVTFRGGGLVALIGSVAFATACASEVAPRDDGRDVAPRLDAMVTDIAPRTDAATLEAPNEDVVEEASNDGDASIDGELDDAVDASPCVFPGFDAHLGGATGSGPCVMDSTEHCSSLFAAMTTASGTVYGGCDPYTASALNCRPFTNCVSMTHFQELSLTEYVACCGNEAACRCGDVCISEDGGVPHCLRATR